MSTLIPQWAAAIARTRFTFVLAAALAGLYPYAALTQTFVSSPFELDGNAVSGVNDDWSNVVAGGGTASASTGLISDPSPQSIFTQGGSKDPENIPSWRHKDGNVPDKDDITNAYAASYSVPDGAGGQDLVIYFGADRLATAGDAQLGFWFFQGGVGPGAGGQFTGTHVLGDILILANFSGGGSVATIELFEWVGSGGSHGSLNLRASGAKCDAVLTTALVCAITNEATIPAPWTYTPKAGTAGTFPAVSFFEGGVNLTKVFGAGGVGGGAIPCFSSFLAETRSSTSTTAVLKDFVADGFPVCGIELSKFCGGGDINAAGNGFIYTVGGSVKNTGFGTLYDVKITDMFPVGSTRADGTPLLADDGIFNIASIGAGKTLCWNGTDPTVTGTPCTSVSVFSFGSTDATLTNNATVVSAVSSGGAQTVTDNASNSCTGSLPEAEIDVFKTCSTTINSVSNALVIGVAFSGTVCNLSGLELKNLSLKNNQPVNPTTLTPSKTTLPPFNGSDNATPPAHCATYSGSYTPSAGSPGAGRLSFSDTVTATANPTIAPTVDITDMGGATCYLCLDENGAACPLPN